MPSGRPTMNDEQLAAWEADMRSRPPVDESVRVKQPRKPGWGGERRAVVRPASVVVPDLLPLDMTNVAATSKKRVEAKMAALMAAKRGQ